MSILARGTIRERSTVIVAMKHKRSLMSIAMAALVLVALFAACASPLSVTAAEGSRATVQAPAALVGAPVASAPAACEFDSSNIYLFAKGTDNALWVNHWLHSSWSGWASLGGYLTSNPAVVSPHVGVIDAFVRGHDGALWSRYTTNEGTSWSNWYKIGGQLLAGTGPAAYAWGDARIGWLVTGTDHALYHMWNDSSTGMHGWEKLGGYLTSSPGATSPTSGVINVFVRGRDSALWQREYNNGWSSWTSLGGKIGPGTGPAACSWPGRLDVFVEGKNGALYHRGYNGTWSSWEDLGGYLTSSPAAATAPGSQIVDVFVRGGDNGLWWKWYTTSWSGWTSLGGI